MKQFNLTIKTPGRGYYLITDQIEQAVAEALSSVEAAVCCMFLSNIHRPV